MIGKIYQNPNDHFFIEIEYANARSVLSKKDGPDVMETDKAVLKAGPVKVISDIRIGFVGGGKMTEAIIKGLLKHGRHISLQCAFISSQLTFIFFLEQPK